MFTVEHIARTVRAHLKYLRYVLLHKLRVFQAGRRTEAPLWRLIVHDMSKFRPSEWGPYTRFFYGPTRRESDAPGPAEAEATDAFDRAWLLHQHRNPHHWQHWVLREDSGATKLLDMPDPLVREMVADWIGAGWVIKNRQGFEDAFRGMLEWWAEKRQFILLSGATRQRVFGIMEDVAISLGWSRENRRSLIWPPADPHPFKLRLHGDG
jgi:hypothetical protein